jgi:hypothetical protein
VATPDPYQYWSGAPKHWVDVPAQRRRPPAPEQLDAAVRHLPDRDGSSSRGEWGVAAVALAVAVAAFVLIGICSARSAPDAPPPLPHLTGGASVR